LLAAFIVKFIPFLRQVNDWKIHAAAAITWAVGSAVEILFPATLTTVLWSEALSGLYVMTKRGRKLSAEYETAELNDLEVARVVE
jgi:hypothetical protein